MVTKRIPQRALVDRLMDFQVHLDEMRIEARDITTIAEAYEKRVRGTGNLPPLARTRGR
jgi:hypothetical protein